MATFTNQATLSYNDNVTNSNVVTGELVEVVTATKTALSSSYGPGDTVTYVVSIVNSGSVPVSGVTVTDNLGEYTYNAQQLTPLTYVDGSVKYYVNGTLQGTPTAAGGPPLTISGISIPAGGSAMLIYEAAVNKFAPLTSGSQITNEATITGAGISDITVDATVTVKDEAILTISKSVCPQSVTENGQLTYTFVIQNSGNTEADSSYNVAVTDTFNPILYNITATYNGAVMNNPTDYTYNVSGEFATVPGRITVPAATYSQDASGAWVVTPGVSVIKVTGTV